MIEKVLLLSPTGVPGGAERALVGLARRLPSFGISPTAVLLADGRMREWLEEVGCPVTVHSAGRVRNIARTIETTRYLAGLARVVDIVISNQSTGHLYGGVAARVAGVPEIWWQQGNPRRSRNELVAAVIPSTAVVCSSQPSATAQRRLTPKRRLKVIHLGSSIEEVQRFRGTGGAIRARLGWDGRHVIGIVGRLQPWKGQETFLRAAALVGAANPEVRFAVVGGAILGWEGDYPERLRRLAAELCISERTVFAGHQDEIYPWFDAMDVVVHASVGEPFGLVLVEAMALGKPLVASASGGPLEIVEDGVSGILFPPGDHQVLAGAINRILTSPQLASSLGENAAKRAELFSEEAMAARFVGLFEEITGRTVAGRPQ